MKGLVWKSHSKKSLQQHLTGEFINYIYLVTYGRPDEYLEILLDISKRRLYKENKRAEYKHKLEELQGKAIHFHNLHPNIMNLNIFYSIISLAINIIK